VLHSATKYLGGHNDLLGGVVIASEEKLEPLRKLRGVVGMVNGPHSVYLLLRGLKTFELRMQRHNENGLAVAEFLADHPRVEKVYYPGLPSHPYYEVAKRTMRGYGGLVTFLLRGADDRQTANVVDAVRIPRIGPSLGGAESLIEQPIVMSYHDFNPQERRAVGIPDNMIRIACGIENPDDLVADLKQALES
jgi:cystathionine gamma-synthase